MQHTLCATACVQSSMVLLCGVARGSVSGYYLLAADWWPVTASIYVILLFTRGTQPLQLTGGLSALLLLLPPCFCRMLLSLACTLLRRCSVSRCSTTACPQAASTATPTHSSLSATQRV